MRILRCPPLLLVVACASSDTAAGPTRDVTVHVTYEGAAPLGDVELLFYDADLGCAEMQVVTGGMPSDQVPWSDLTIQTAADGAIPDRGLTLPADVEVRVVVARARLKAGDGAPRLSFVTYGCTEVASGATIDLVLRDIWPRASGTFSIKAGFDTAVPFDDANHVDAELMALASEPGIPLLRMVALATAGDRYWTAAPFDLLFGCDDEDETSGACFGSIAPTALGIIAGTAVQETFDAAVADLRDAEEDTLAGSLTYAREYMDETRFLSLSGNLTIDAEPDAQGAWPGAWSMVFVDTEVAFGNQSGRLALDPPFQPSATGLSASVAYLPGDAGMLGVTLPAFTIPMDPEFARLLVASHIWLPMGLGFDFRSFEELWATIPCNDLGQAVADATGIDALGDNVTSGCVTLGTSASAALHAWCASHGTTTIELATPDGEACTLNVWDAHKQYSVETIGTSDPSCVWNGDVRMPSSSEPLEVTWEARRQ